MRLDLFAATDAGLFARLKPRLGRLGYRDGIAVMDVPACDDIATDRGLERLGVALELEVLRRQAPALSLYLTRQAVDVEPSLLVHVRFEIDAIALPRHCRFSNPQKTEC